MKKKLDIVYENNQFNQFKSTYKKDLSWLDIDDKPRSQEGKQVKD